MSQAEFASNAGGLFHGWKIVGVSLLTQALQAGILIYAFGTIAVSIEQEFGVSRAEVMLCATVLSLTTNFISPLLGKLVDSQSVRLLMLLAIASLALGLVALSATRSLWQVWLVFGTLLPLGNVLLGQLTTAALMARWFSRLRGRALGIAAVGTSIGGFTIPVMLTFLFEQYGWRQGLAMLGIGAFLVTAPLIFWIVRDRPADLGVHADGAEEPPEEPGHKVAQGGLVSILRDRAFWCETAAIGIALFVYLGFLSNLYPHALAIGTEPARAGLVMSIVALCSIGGKLAFGFVADRIDLRLTLWISFALMIVGALVLGNIQDGTGLVAGAMLFGLAAGGLLPVWGAMVAKSFGQARFGRALGTMNLAMAPITLLSAPYAGYLFDRTGSYELAFTSYAGILLIGALVLLPLKFPQPTEPAQP